MEISLTFCVILKIPPMLNVKMVYLCTLKLNKLKSNQ